MDKNKTQKIVREVYGKIAQRQEGCGCGHCGPDTTEFAKSIGYSEEELRIIPDEANLALSCGNPTSLASLREDEVVLDLDSGAGFDCFLAAAKVGPNGKVIGVDMTPEMVEAYAGCVGGALLVDEYRKIVETTGLNDVKVTVKGSSACIAPDTKDPIGRAISDSLEENESLEDYVVSIYAEGYK